MHLDCDMDPKHYLKIQGCNNRRLILSLQHVSLPHNDQSDKSSSLGNHHLDYILQVDLHANAHDHMDDDSI